MFREYSDVCVAGHGTKGNGTFLAQNLYAIAYNYAAVDGRGVYATEIDCAHPLDLTFPSTSDNKVLNRL